MGDKNKSMIQMDALLAVIIDSFTGFLKNLPTQAAASIAYYFLLSFFPLLLFMVIFLSYFLDVATIQNEIVNFLQGVLPGTERIITENLQTLLNNRGSTSLLASVTLLWSGSGMINSIIHNVERAWAEKKTRGYFINRALAIISVLILTLVAAALMLFSLMVNLSDLFQNNQLSNILKLFNIEMSAFNQVLINLLSAYILPVLVLYLLGFLLYYRIPSAEVDRGAARSGALLFSLGWRILTRLFGSYVLSPMNRYDLIYGSVTTIVLMLLYVYFSAFIVIYPAHLVAAITHYKRRRISVQAAKEEARKFRIKQIAGKPKKGNSRQPILDDPLTLAPTPHKSTFKETVNDLYHNLMSNFFRIK